MEIGFETEIKTPEEFRGELKNELNRIDMDEAQTESKMEASDLVIPDNVTRTIVRLENAAILAILTKNDSPAIKQAAREALEPSKDDLKVVNDFLFQVIKRYSPKVFADPLTTAGYIYAANLATKMGTVYAIKEGMK